MEGGLSDVFGSVGFDHKFLVLYYIPEKVNFGL